MGMRQYFEPTDYAHLYREKNSGIYYARVDSRQGGRKTIRRSLKTKDINEAIAKMAAFLQEMGTNIPTIGNISWYVAVDTYIAQQKMRPNLKPRALESALLFAEHARKLVEQDVAAEAITANMCRLWWTKKSTELFAKNGQWSSWCSSKNICYAQGFRVRSFRPYRKTGEIESETDGIFHPGKRRICSYCRRNQACSFTAKVPGKEP